MIQSININYIIRRTKKRFTESLEMKINRSWANPNLSLSMIYELLNIKYA